MRIGRIFLLLALICTIAGLPAHARFRRGFGYGYGPNGWHGGYWIHGTYLGYAGWWWVVGPTWYYYPGPVYPSPPAGAQPAYVVQVETPPPPEGAPSNTNVMPPPPDTASRPSPLPSSSGNSKAFTYFCEKTKSYYPMAKSCDDGWIVTPAKPPN